MKSFIIFCACTAGILPFHPGEAQTSKPLLPPIEPPAFNYQFPHSAPQEAPKEFRTISFGSVQLRPRDQYDERVGDSRLLGPKKMFALRIKFLFR